MRRLIKWLVGMLDSEDIYVVPREVLDILDIVRQKMDEVDTLEHLSAEAKRSCVYGSMVKRFPDMPRKQVAMAIEILMHERS